MISRAEFVELFAIAIGFLRESEEVTKRELKALSRTLLAALHGVDADALLTGDIQFVNQTLPVLSNVHRKVAVLFFQHFAGFHYDDGTKVFTKKSAKRYAEAREAAVAFLADPNQNIFTWAEREIVVERKPFEMNKVTTFISGALKKAPGVGKTRVDVLRAVFAGGFTAVELLAVMEELQAQELARQQDPANQPAPM
jgi:hypothetical protein